MAPGVRHLHPEDDMVRAMLSGWAKQQLGGRLCAENTVKVRASCVGEFIEFSGAYPWEWTARMMDEWSAHLVGSLSRAKSTIRQKQGAVRLFCSFITSPYYDWPTQCELWFGDHPTQICHEWNTSAHLVDYEGDPGRRPFTRKELQDFLDCADAQVENARRSRRKGTLAAYRDTTMFKVMYGWGLRINELCRLDLADMYRNPHAPELGQCGFLHVRYGKASRGSPPKRRTVPTLMPWAAEALLDYVNNIRPLYEPGQKQALWLTERRSQVKVRTLTGTFDDIRDEVGLDRKLTPHCFRHSFISHMTEDGVDPRFLQEISGHRFASTTGIYTHVTGEFMNKMLTDALGRVSSFGEGRE
ncbi:tyrosine-type recombinase/integrase [Mycobacterium syngnathidarum]